MNANGILKAAVATVALLAAGCGDDGDSGMGPTDNGGGNENGGETPMGSLQITTVTNGVQIDTDGYAYAVDGGAETPIGVNDTTTLDLPAGDHTVTLTDIQSNCDPVTTSWDVTVSEGELTTLAFQMGCVAWISDRIVFESDRDGNSEIWVMAADGSNPEQLTDLGGAREPAVSPDGRRIAFNLGYELWVMDADGANPQVIAAEGNNPAWSPDGSKIAYNAHSGTSSSRDLFVMNANGTSPVNLTNTFGLHETQPSWSPDGTRIAYRQANGAAGTFDIYVMNADGSGAHDLLPYGGDEAYPAWSPDGTQIAYVSTRCRPIDLYPCGDNEVHVAAADGSSDRYVTNTLVEDLRPSWSPDGSKLAFDSMESGDPEIWIMDADGSNRVNISNTQGTDTLYPQCWAR